MAEFRSAASGLSVGKTLSAIRIHILMNVRSQWGLDTKGDRDEAESQRNARDRDPSDLEGGPTNEHDEDHQFL